MPRVTQNQNMLKASTSKKLFAFSGDKLADFILFHNALVFLLTFFLLRMSDIISRRQRTPWFWPDFVYNYFGDGKEHNKTLRVLHLFTYKVSEISSLLRKNFQRSSKRCE